MLHGVLGLRFRNWGGDLGLTAQRPRCLRIFSMTSSASMKAMTAIGPWHLGHVRGSTWDAEGQEKTYW